MEEEIVADTTVLSNFSLVSRLDILKELFGERLCITKEVLEELEAGINRKVLPQFDRRRMKVLEVESRAERSLFSKLIERFGAVNHGLYSCCCCVISEITDDATNDSDFERVDCLRVWVP